VFHRDVVLVTVARLLHGGRREFFGAFKAETDSPNLPVVRPLLDAWLGWPVALCRASGHSHYSTSARCNCSAM
jgi:hypothetical protein